MRLTIHTRHRRLLIATGDDYNDPDPEEPPPAHIAVTAGDFTPAPDMPPEPSPEWAEDKHIGFTPPRIPREQRAHHIRQATDRLTQTLNDKDQPTEEQS